MSRTTQVLLIALMFGSLQVRPAGADMTGCGNMATNVRFHRQIFCGAVDELESALKNAEKNDSDFTESYRGIRTSAFKLEIMSKFFEKDEDNSDAFTKLRALSKNLEDRLGKFNELDELTKFVPRTAKKQWKQKLVEEAESVRAWMGDEGWTADSKTGAIVELRETLSAIGWMSESDAIKFITKKIAKKFRKRQEQLEEGAYSAKNKSGYSLEEVETKAHELRRDIRELTMIMQYTGGAFAFDLDGTHLTPKAANLSGYYDFVKKLPSASAPFAKLPKITVESPIFVPQTLFLLLSEYVVEIGDAKDWVQVRQKLVDEGFESVLPDLDQVTPDIKDVYGEEQSFNQFMADLLGRIREDKLFTVWADVLD